MDKVAPHSKRAAQRGLSTRLIMPSTLPAESTTGTPLMLLLTSSCAQKAREQAAVSA